MTDAGTAPGPGREGDEVQPAGERNWLVVAKKDVADSARSWQLYALFGAFTAILTLGSLRPALEQMALREERDAVPAQLGLETVAELVGVFVPLVVLLLGYRAIVGARERGRLRVLLALPVSRRDVLLGKLVGRATVVAVSLAASLLLNGVAMLLVYDSLGLRTYVKFATTVLAFAVVFAGMAVGISAGARTRGRALTVSLGSFLLFTFLWGPILTLVEAVTGVTPEVNITSQNVAPGWYVFLERARPSKAWQLLATKWGVPVLPELGRGADSYHAPFTTPGPEPFYLDPWALLVVLLAWGGVPLLVGYTLFRRTDVQ